MEGRKVRRGGAKEGTDGSVSCASKRWSQQNTVFIICSSASSADDANKIIPTTSGAENDVTSPSTTTSSSSFVDDDDNGSSRSYQTKYRITLQVRVVPCKERVVRHVQSALQRCCTKISQ